MSTTKRKAAKKGAAKKALAPVIAINTKKVAKPKAVKAAPPTLAAIKKLRSAHTKAGRELTKAVRARFPIGTLVTFQRAGLKQPTAGRVSGHSGSTLSLRYQAGASVRTAYDSYLAVTVTK